MLFFKKKYLFIWGSYFWNYKAAVIKAYKESEAIEKFLSMGYEDINGWTVREMRDDTIMIFRG